MTKVISVLNMKGGVGKTTFTYNLAWYAACKRSLKVLVVDLDPQANLSQLFMGDEGYLEFMDEDKLSVADIFENPVRLKEDVVHVVEESYDGSLIHLIPSKLELSNTLKNPTTKERRLSRFLSVIRESYDLVLIDCPPTDSILTTASYLASEHIVIPVVPQKLATIGLPLLAQSVKNFNQDQFGEHEVKVAGVFFNVVNHAEENENELARDHVKSIAVDLDWKVFNKEVRRSRSYVRGVREGRPVFLTSYTQGQVAQEFFDLGQEILESVGIQ